MHPIIFMKLIEMCLCQNFNIGSYLRIYLDENCESERYQNFFYYIILPSLIIFSGLMPFLILIYILFKKKEGTLFDKSISSKIGFIITDFRRTKYFW